MAIIINIDVSGQQGLVALSQNGTCIDSIVNAEPMQHASFLQPAIQALLSRNKVAITALNAVAISNGPGSYTGLRVGLASAKGLCFALNIPMITLNTLQVIAKASSSFVEHNSKKFINRLSAEYSEAKSEKEPLRNEENNNTVETIFCPMIDARRMEVFFGVFDKDNNTIIEPGTAIIDENFLFRLLQNNTVYFSGSGAKKWMQLTQHPNALFLPELPVNEALCELSFSRYNIRQFVHLSLLEPFYCKEFYNPNLKISLQ